MQKDPNPTAAGFARGVALVPAADLVRWLAEQKRDIGKPVKLRLPVTLIFKDTNQLGIANATIGSAADAPSVKLDDSALGVGIMDRIHGKCPGATTCAVWLEGNWRGIVDGKGQFFVTKVGPMIEAGAAPDHAEIESP
jgi:hypothetical protein